MPKLISQPLLYASVLKDKPAIRIPWIFDTFFRDIYCTNNKLTELSKYIVKLHVLCRMLYQHMMPGILQAQMPSYDNTRTNYLLQLLKTYRIIKSTVLLIGFIRIHLMTNHVDFKYKY